MMLMNGLELGVAPILCYQMSWVVEASCRSQLQSWRFSQQPHSKRRRFDLKRGCEALRFVSAHLFCSLQPS